MVSKAWLSASRLSLVIVLVSSSFAEADEGLSRARTIEAGREQFARVRHHSTKSLGAAENVDRFFNARSCAECHQLGGLGGAGSNEHNVQLISPIVPVPSGRPDPLESRRTEIEKRARPLSLRTNDVAREEHERDSALARFKPIGTTESRILHRRSSLVGYDEWRRALLPELQPATPACNPRRQRMPLAVPIGPTPTTPMFTFAVPPSAATPPTARPTEAEEDGKSMLLEAAQRTRVITGPFGLTEVTRFLQMEQRNTPALFGLGLIDSIPQAEIDRIAAAQPAEVRGISPRLRTGGRGRFGWKAQNATLADFNEGACAAELGLRTEKFAPSEWVTFRKRSASSREESLPPMAAIDMTSSDLAALTAYVAALPEPRQVIDSRNRHDAGQGEFLFRTTGCAVCHVPDIGGVIGIYSDLLLHDTGAPSATTYYGAPIGPPPAIFDIVSGVHIRTPPLWGVADSAPYLHDGSAATLEEAIAGHQAQAFTAAESFRTKLSDDERRQVIAFLRSLRAPQVALRK